MNILNFSPAAIFAFVAIFKIRDKDEAKTRII